MKKIITSIILFLLLSCAVFALALRGIPGNPTPATMNLDSWKDSGPLELSPDRGRFALTMSLVDNKSFTFSLPIAEFATPDLGYHNGKYVSLFAPAVSFAIIPGYIIGKAFNASQVGSFAVVSIFAVLNGLLIIGIARKLGAHIIAAVLAALVFLFATPAFTYGVSLYEHHFSTFLILLSIYLLVSWNSIWSLAGIWFLCALSIPVDYPNLILMFPIGFYALGRIIFVSQTKLKTTVHVKLLRILSIITVLAPLAFFLWFNQMSYGNPLQFSGTVMQIQALDSHGKPAVDKDEKTSDTAEDTQQHESALNFFKPRNFINGLYILLISPDRGILIYTPIIVLSLLGAYFLYQSNPGITSMLVGVFSFDLVLYSMWGDPWGGWAFGPRYLIPGFSVLAVLLAIALTRLQKNKVFIAAFVLLFIYSVGVNTLGAITSSKVPPQVQIAALEKQSGIQEKYSFDRDIDILTGNYSKSFVWQTFAKKYMTADEYYLFLVSLIVVPALACTTLLYLSRKENRYEIS